MSRFALGEHRAELMLHSFSLSLAKYISYELNCRVASHARTDYIPGFAERSNQDVKGNTGRACNSNGHCKAKV
jgi:hypothetical protein